MGDAIFNAEYWDGKLYEGFCIFLALFYGCFKL